MAEELTLTTAEAPPVAGATKYRVARLVLDMGIGPLAPGQSAQLQPEFAAVSVVLIGDNGALRTMPLWTGDAARAAIQTLNTADLRVNTLNRRIIARVQALDAAMAGTIADVP